MPNPIEPDKKLDPLILDLDKPNSKFNIWANQSDQDFVRHNRAEINQLAAILSAVATNLNQNLLEGLNLHLPKINAAIAAGIPPLPRMPLIDPSLLRQISQVVLPPIIPDSLLKSLLTEGQRIYQTLGQWSREYLRDIQIALQKPDPFWSDIFDAMDGNSSAAEHVALRISWHPKRWEREIIRLRSRFEGTPLKDIRQQALVQGVLLALSWDQEAEVPLWRFLCSVVIHPPTHARIKVPVLHPLAALRALYSSQSKTGEYRRLCL